MSDQTLAYRTCPLCEATCGLEITISDGRGGSNPRRSPGCVLTRVHLSERFDPRKAAWRPGQATPSYGQEGRRVRGRELG